MENRPDSRPFDGYDDFSMSIQTVFDSLVESDTPIFITKAENLFETFLQNIPEEGRQHYNCNACRSFVNKFGGLVTISEHGKITPLLWGYVPPFFQDAVLAVRREIERSKIDSVFITDIYKLGTPITGEWHHLHLKYPKQRVSKDRLKTPYQLMADKKEEFKMLLNATLEFNLDVAKNAYHLASSGTLYRSDKVLEISKFFYELKSSLEGVPAKTRDNLLWRAVAKAPEGFCHIKSSMIGTLLEDINAGMSTRMIKARFEEKMDPTAYGRSQNAPSANAILEAEKVVAELGIETALQRRYARFEEVPTAGVIWKPESIIYRANELTKQAQAGVFANVTPRNKDTAPQQTTEVEPSVVMSWLKFVRTVLPNATELDAMVSSSNRLMALVTAVDTEAKNILQWDNPFSWYYHAGIDGEIKRRVEGAGGRYENNEIRCSLIWGTRTDLDLHCITPSGKHIYFGDKQRDRGFLDVDMNVMGETLEPVENIRFQTNAPQGGVYRFYVHNYRNRSAENLFKVELEINGILYTYEGDLRREKEEVTAFEFDYRKDSDVRFINALRKGFGVSYAGGWNVSGFTKVKGIVKSPNLWSDIPVVHVGQHTFFLLDDCRDESEGKGKGFFTEMLKSELRPIRRTLDAFTNNAAIQGVEEATACGLGFSIDSDWNLMLRAKTATGTQLIKIDRFE